MSLHRRIHRRITHLTLYSLALSLAVVLWGAEYKMEQYPERGLAFRVMPPAKLLTEKERPVQKGSVKAVLARASQKRGSGAWPAWSARRSRPRFFSPPREQQLAVSACKAGDSPEFTHFSSRPPPARLL
ncbi:MAG: hypothetical protein WCF17_21440 [Terracidiphilus sp.]